MMDNILENEAQQIYWDVYGKVVNWKNFKGDPMPKFSDLPDKIKEAWKAVAQDKIDSMIEYNKWRIARI